MQVAQGRTIKGLAHFVMGGPVDGAVAITVVADRERDRERERERVPAKKLGAYFVVLYHSLD